MVENIDYVTSVRQLGLNQTYSGFSIQDCVIKGAKSIVTAIETLMNSLKDNSEKKKARLERIIQLLEQLVQLLSDTLAFCKETVLVLDHDLLRLNNTFDSVIQTVGE